MRLSCAQSCFTCLAVAAFAAVVGAQSSTVPGTLADGPQNQGSCSPSGSDAFLCSNGAFCTWDAAASNFSCVGGSGDVVTETGPPGRDCVSHEDHWDCTGADGAEELCEREGDVWVCQSLGAGGEGGGSGAPCIVHGGHTHGDCSGRCNNLDLGYYDMDMHIVSLFIVLIASFLGAMLPILATQQLRQPLIRWAFFIGKHFGTGIILSTAFIHLLFHSFVMFGNACLGELKFEPAASAISLAGVLVVFFSDFAMMRWMQSRRPAPAAAPVKGVEAGTASQEGSVNADQAKDTAPAFDSAHTHAHGAAGESEIDYSSPQAHFDVYLLEAGIIFHSIMIGVSLGASGGDQWQPLFIAIIFHQFFEGLALGSRISLLVWKDGSTWHKWFMGSAFGLITPIGIAIGIGVHSSYNPNSGAALLSIGILDAVSAGVLLYAGIVELLVHDYMHGELARARAGRVGIATASLFAGAICMSVLGKWA